MREEEGSKVEESRWAGLVRLLVIAGGIYVIVRHRANIQRLLSGTEPRLGQSSVEAKTAGQV